MRQRTGASSAALALVIAFGGVASAKPLHVKGPSTLKTDAGNERRLPPVWILDETDWAVLDVETRRLQDRELALGVENTALRKAIADDMPFGLGTILALGLSFVAGGAVILYIK